MTISVPETGTYLDRILAQTVVDLAARQARMSVTELDRMTASRPAPASLAAALTADRPAVIAEIKRASPSRGLFPVAVEPAAVAASYLAGGAAALSVLTDEPFFRGSLADLAAVAEVARARPRPAPVLRKDFIVDEYQIREALAFGADAILLIVAALEDGRLRALSDAARDLGLAALVEVHTEAEMARAVAAGAEIIGINNRDLRSFAVDLAVTERLARQAPPEAVLIGESGIFTAADVQRLMAAGVDAVLVGESLITAPDRAAAVAALRQVEAG